MISDQGMAHPACVHCSGVVLTLLLYKSLDFGCAAANAARGAGSVDTDGSTLLLFQSEQLKTAATKKTKKQNKHIKQSKVEFVPWARKVT